MEGRAFVMGVNEFTVQRVPWARMTFWTAKSMYQVAGCTTCHPIHVEAGGTRSNRSCACMQAGTTRLIRHIGPSRASQCLSAVYSTSVAFHGQKHSRIDTAVNHVIIKLWLDHLGTIFKPYRESWDISRQTSSPHPLTCTDTIIPPSVSVHNNEENGWWHVGVMYVTCGDLENRIYWTKSYSNWTLEMRMCWQWLWFDIAAN